MIPAKLTKQSPYIKRLMRVAGPTQPETFHNRSMTSLERLRKHERVEHVDVEDGNGVIVTLRQGWTFDQQCDNRVAGEDTAKKALALVASAFPFSGPFTD